MGLHLDWLVLSTGISPKQDILPHDNCSTSLSWTSFLKLGGSHIVHGNSSHVLHPHNFQPFHLLHSYNLLISCCSPLQHPLDLRRRHHYHHYYFCTPFPYCLRLLNYLCTNILHVPMSIKSTSPSGFAWILSTANWFTNWSHSTWSKKTVNLHLFANIFNLTTYFSVMLFGPWVACKPVAH